MIVEAIGSGTDEIKPWIVLQKVETANQPVRYLQQGPYATSELRTRVYKGEFSFQDFVWKRGLDNWTLIRDIKELQPEAPKVSAFSRRDPLHSLIEDTQQQNVHIEDIPKAHKEPSVSAVDFDPVEAVTEDLAHVQINFIPKWHQPNLDIIETEMQAVSDYESQETFRPIEANASTLGEPAHVGSKAFQDMLPGSKLRQAIAIRLVTVAFCLPLLVGAYLVWMGLFKPLVSSRQDHVNAKMTTQPMAHSSIAGISSGAGEGSNSSDSGATSRSESPPASSLNQQQIVLPAGSQDENNDGVFKDFEIAGLGWENNAPLLVFRAPVQPGEAIEIWVMGQPGKILGQIREERYFKETATQPGIIKVDARPWKLAMGEYVIYARLGDRKVARRMFLGRRNQRFHIAMARYRASIKQHAHTERDELKATIINLSRELQDFAGADGKRIVPGIGSDAFLERWLALKKVSALGNLDRNQLVFADAWQNVQKLSIEVESQIKEGKLNDASRFLSELSGFEKDVDRLSL